MNIVRLVSVLVAFGVGFVLLPWVVLPRPSGARTVLDHLTINFIRWTAAVIIGTHILVMLRLYETLMIAAVLLIAFWYFKLRPGGWDRQKFRNTWNHFSLRMIAIGDAAERGEVRMRRRRGMGGGYSSISSADEDDETMISTPERENVSRNTLRRGSRLVAILLLVVPVVAVLVASLWLRIESNLNELALSPPDAYIHMTWAKGLTTNQIWVDGLYPMGMPAILAWTSKFSFQADMLDIARFVGPIVGTLIVFGIFYTALRLTGNPGAAIFAAGLFGLLGTRPEWHEPWYRQIGPLPQEFALALTVMAIPFGVLAVLHRDKSHLITIACAGLAIGLTHPIPLPFFMLFIAVGAFATAILSGGFKWAFGASVVAFLAGAASFLYIPIGTLIGKSLYGPITNLNPFTGGGGEAETDPGASAFLEDIGYNPVSRLAIICVVIGAVAGIVLLFSRSTRSRGVTLLALCAVSATVLALYDVRWIGLDVFYATRSAQIVGPLLTLAFAAGLGALTILITRRMFLAGTAIAIVAGFVALAAFSNVYPARARDKVTIEYESTAQVTDDIAGEYERFTYTIVGIPQQRQQILGDGWFIEGWVFARDASLRSARDPGYQMNSRQGIPRTSRDVGDILAIPTQDIFIFVEKKTFENPELDPAGPTEEYYFNNEKRGRIQARMYLWSELYMRYHTDMTVYFEDDDIKVYRISRTPDVDAAEDTPEFKDYTWRPGELFNTGPASVEEVELP
jgi:hypothetical protein